MTRKSKISKIDFKFRIVIPARYASTRLPGKPLLDINGKPMIQHVFESALQCNAESITIATDDIRIQECAESFGAGVVMTSIEHLSGTDRLAEVVSKLKFSDDEIIVNLQGDEIGVPSDLIHQVARNLHEHTECSLATVCEKIEKMDDIKDPNIVKVIFDQNNHAIYFSRAAIPHQKDSAATHTNTYFKHIGLYAYRAGYIKEFTSMPACEIELIESLEQLRALHSGKKIHVEEACATAGMGIDTEEDLNKARAQIH